jgi:membrane protease YdiL (CAAX protease family)
VSTPNETILPVPPISSQTVPERQSSFAPPAPSAGPDNPPWGILMAFVAWLSSIAVLFILPNIFLAPYIAYHYQGLPKPTQDVLFSDKTLVLLLVSSWLPAHLLTLLVIWAIATKLGKFSLKEVFGWSWSPNFGVWKSAGFAASLFAIAWVITAVFGGKDTDLDRILQSSRAAALMLAFLAVATAPLVEEMIYRGLLYSALQRVTGRLFAVLIVAGMFAGLHVFQYRQNIGAILSIAILSLSLTALRAKTGRLLPCYVIHLIFNGVQSLIIVFYPYLNSLVESSRTGAAKGAVTCIFRCLG